MTGAQARPLASWSQRAPFRDYQADILRSARPDDGATLHIVAPPGAGKTVIGFGLAARNGRRALVLAPTTVIRAQWIQQAAEFFSLPDGGAPSTADGAPTEGRAPADLTALTYQALSVVETDGPWEEAARERWTTDLMRDGRARERATDWLDALARDNPAAYKRGIASRASTIRSRVDELDDDAIAALLGAGARKRLDALVAAGIATIIVDECHHLRAHWALVVHYLLRRLRAAGAELSHRIGQYLLAPDGIDYLLGLVAPGISPDALAPAQGSGDPGDGGLQPLAADDPRLLAALAAGFDADPDQAATASALLARADRYTPTPLSTLVAPLLPSLASPDTEEELSLLARYALDRLLPDPARRADWDHAREGLRGFGISLTDSGIRAGRSPLDVMTAASRAKDTAVIDILRHELDALGERLRAVVVTDAAERSAPHRALDVLIGADRPGAAGGATRCFSTILSDGALRALHPVLLTASRLAVARDDGAILDALRERTGLELPALDDGWTLSVTGGGARSAEVVLAISELVAAGDIRIIVGTRGLLGEGWDCPAVNTLVDLTTVTTSAAVQQLRGRTIRIDPGWEGKVSHNWSVVCLLPGDDGLRARGPRPLRAPPRPPLGGAAIRPRARGRRSGWAQGTRGRRAADHRGPGRPGGGANGHPRAGGLRAGERRRRGPHRPPQRDHPGHPRGPLRRARRLAYRCHHQHGTGRPEWRGELQHPLHPHHPPRGAARRAHQRLGRHHRRAGPRVLDERRGLRPGLAAGHGTRGRGARRRSPRGLARRLWQRAGLLRAARSRGGSGLDRAGRDRHGRARRPPGPHGAQAPLRPGRHRHLAHDRCHGRPRPALAPGEDRLPAHAQDPPGPAAPGRGRRIGAPSPAPARRRARPASAHRPGPLPRGRRGPGDGVADHRGTLPPPPGSGDRRARGAHRRARAGRDRGPGAGHAAVDLGLTPARQGRGRGSGPGEPARGRRAPQPAVPGSASAVSTPQEVARRAAATAASAATMR